ncbi:MAG: histidine kinase [Parafilimonas sp.]
MKIKWRQHEIILLTANAVIILVGYLWNIYYSSTGLYANVFIQNNVPFSLFKNVILPDISLGLTIYLCYLWINLYTIPRLFFLKKFEAGFSKNKMPFSNVKMQGIIRKKIKEYAWLFIQVVLLILLLGSVSDISTYLKHEWQFHYPGFSIFFNPNIPDSQLNLSEGFFAAGSIIVLYGLYAFVREVIVRRIAATKQREYNTEILNRVTLFVLVLITLYVFIKAFNLIHEQTFFVYYFLIIPAIAATFITNVYGLFPKKGNDSFFSKKIIVPLLSTSFFYSVPLIVIIHEAAPVAFLYGWAVQLFIATPITWLYYQSHKDKILQLKIVETQLVKSKADIQFLRSQINPHFLFNVLNTLYGTALQENAERTAEGIQKLGDMMRFMLHENNLDFIKMTKEIEYLKNYIALQKLRTQSSPEIIIEDNISEQNCNHKIAPMLLIPLVENAFKHGISLKEKSCIKINLECNEKEILFEVHNSIHTKRVQHLFCIL